ncbi:MAG: UDP-N-acetyl-D-galactosamine dehydrogenase [Candidatus Azotimanducaceae bacterium]|jgi:UDP-N-acetyl-D-galactosamine dehydrogenase
MPEWQKDKVKIAVIGLGYVGLPLAVEFGRHFSTIGFDINETRINQLNDGIDLTREISEEEFKSSPNTSFTTSANELKSANFYIVTVPTPIDDSKQPDLTPLESASRAIADHLKVGDIVVYESTVYPGATEEVCIPLLEAGSGLTFNKDFFAGYSPERINPGDKVHRLPSIVKITSGSTPEAANYIDEIYKTIIQAGTHLAPSIKVAEAAKVIENTQRDLNIALINELSIIFNKLDIDTTAVLEAAGTKWNFLNFTPGLVGGHCIGVDPYYLTHKAQQIGYQPQVILAGRRINDGMGEYVVSTVIRLMIKKHIHVAGSTILILGLAFKEDCGDIRNTRVTDIVAELESYDANVDVYDPQVDPVEVEAEYGIQLVPTLETDSYDAIILAVSHREFAERDAQYFHSLGKEQHVFFEVKPLFEAHEVDGRL